MDPLEEPALSRRARRAVALIAASLTVIVVASILYLHPKIEGPTPKVAAPSPAPTPKLIPNRYWADFAFVTPSLGWSLVESQTTSQFWIFRTTDGAKTWEQQLSSQIDRNHAFSFSDRRRPIQFFDHTHGLVFTSNGLYRTQDGGKYWARVNVPPYQVESASFPDPVHGWILGFTPGDAPNNATYHIQYTADGGISWTELPSPPRSRTSYGLVMGGLKFRNPGEGWARGNDDQPTIYSSKDGGATWQQHLLPFSSQPPQGKPAYRWTDVSLLPGRGVLAMTRDAAFTSFDGGETWRQTAPPPGTVSYADYVFQDATHWWVMQYDSNLYKTSDAGKSWQRVSFQLDDLVYTLGVVDGRNAWARLDSQVPTRRGYGLALTKDGGVHWTYANVPAPP